MNSLEREFEWSKTCDMVEEERDQLKKEIAALKEENERLKKQALVWRKWPEEKPTNETFVLVENHWGQHGVVHYSDSHGFLYYTSQVKYWAEIPEPKTDR